MEDLIKVLKSNQGNLTLESVDKAIPLPPASLQSMLKKDLGIPGILISNHKKAFVNPYYNTEWDTFQTISSSQLTQHLAGIARSVSAAVYELATGKSLPSDIQANTTLVC